MNAWSNRTGSLAGVVVAIHLLLDHVDPVRLHLRSALADRPEGALQAVWHLVSIDLALGASTLLYLGIVFPTGSGLVAAVLVAHFGAYAAVSSILAFQLNRTAVVSPCRNGCYFFPSPSISDRRSMMRDGRRLHNNLVDVTT